MTAQTQLITGVFLSLLVVASTIAFAIPATGTHEVTSNGRMTSHEADALETTTTPGEDNSTLSLNGSASASAADSVSLDIDGSELTIEAWIKYNSTSAGNARIVTKDMDGSAATYGLRLQHVGSDEGRQVVAVVNTDDDFAKVTSETDVPAGRWTHLALVYNGTKLTLYINGEVDATANLTGTVGTNGKDLWIGREADTASDFYAGRIDELRIWNRSRAGSEIRSDRFESLNGSEPRLVSYYQFSEASNGIVNDSAGSNGLTLSGGATLESPNVHPVSPDLYARADNGTVRVVWDERIGPDGQNNASQFNVYRSTDPEGSDRQLIATLDGSTTTFTDTRLATNVTYFYEVTTIDADGRESDFSPVATATPYANGGGASLPLDRSSATYGQVADRPALDIDDQTLTLEGWIKYNSTSAGNARIVTKDMDGSAATYGLRLNHVGSDEGRQIVAVVNTDNDFAEVTSETDVPAGRWTHVALVYNGSKLVLYINGEVDAAANLTGRVGTNGKNLWVGREADSASNFYSGRIDDLRIWETARTAAQIQATYQAELWGNESALVAYWQFDWLGSTAARSLTPDRKRMTVNASAIAQPGATPVPPDLFANADNGTARLEWDVRQGDVRGFTLYRSTDAEGSDRQLVAILDGNTTSSIDTGLATNVTYFYEVAAIGPNGRESDFSPVATATPYASNGGASLPLDRSSATYGKVADRPSLDIDDQTLTVETWLKYKATSAGNARIVTKDTTGSAATYGLRLRHVGSDEGRRVIAAVNTNQNFAEVTSETDVPAGRWTHVALVYNGSRLVLYINGEVDASKNLSGAVSTNSKDLWIGREADSAKNFYSGHIDEVRIWETARTADEIRTTYREELMGNEDGLVAYWQFDWAGSSTARSLTPDRGNMVVNASAIGHPGATPVPPDLFARADNGTVRLKWNPRQDNATGFKLYRSTNFDGNDRQLVTTLAANTTSFTDAGLDPNVTYFYEVTAVDTNGRESDFSPFVSATPYADRGGGSLPLNSSAVTYARVQDRPALDIDDQTLTVETWLKYDATSDSSARILTKDMDGSAATYGIRLKYVGSDESRQLVAVINTNQDFAEVTSDSDVPAGRWTHVALVYNGSKLVLYVDAEVEASKNLTGTVATNGKDLWIGREADSASNFYDGHIDEVRIWETVRTAEQIRATYQEELTGSEDGLVAYWPFDWLGSSIARSLTPDRKQMSVNASAIAQPGSTPVPPAVFVRGNNGSSHIEWTPRQENVEAFKLYRSTDSEGRDRQLVTTLGGSATSYTDIDLTTNGTYIYGVTTVDANGRESDLPRAASALVSEQAAGVAFKLNASDAHGRVSDRASLDIDDETLTVETWIKYNATSADNARIVTKDLDGSAATYGLRLDHIGSAEEREIVVGVNTNSDSGSLSSNRTVFAGNWTHVALVYNGSKLVLYINGEMDAAANLTGTVETNGKDLWIGREADSAGNFYAGRIDELRIWGTARTAAQIRANYRNELVGNEQGLIAYWRGCNLPWDGEAHGSTARRMTASLTNVTCDVSGVPLAVNEPPVAAFDHTPESPIVNQTVTLNSSASIDLDGFVTRFEWDLDNDGNFETTGEEITHAFSTARNHSVTLRVIDDHGATDTNASLIEVQACSALAPELPEPTDPDGDGFYEDSNGNGRFDFDDIVTLFEELSNAQPACMDFNVNGRMDFDDIVTLFGEI